MSAVEMGTSVDAERIARVQARQQMDLEGLDDFVELEPDHVGLLIEMHTFDRLAVLGEDADLRRIPTRLRKADLVLEDARRLLAEVLRDHRDER